MVVKKEEEYVSARVENERLCWVTGPGSLMKYSTKGTLKCFDVSEHYDVSEHFGVSEHFDVPERAMTVDIVGLVMIFHELASPNLIHLGTRKSPGP